MKITSLITVAILAFVTIGFFSSCAPSNARPLEVLSAPATGTDTYKINKGDSLQINVWGEPKLSGDVTVRDDGKISVQLIEDTPAAGRTLSELSQDITQRLGAFVPGASVSVSVSKTAPVRYFLSGKFVKPGEYRSDGRITLLQAVATGNGFAPFADESSMTLIRKGPEGELRYELDYNLVIDGRQPNPELKDGDFISVKE